MRHLHRRLSEGNKCFKGIQRIIQDKAPGEAGFFDQGKRIAKITDMPGTVAVARENYRMAQAGAPLQDGSGIWPGITAVTVRT